MTVLVRCWCVNHSRYNPLLSRVSSLPDLIISVSSYRTLFLEKYGKPSRFEKVWHLIIPMFVFSWFEKLWKLTLPIFFFCPFEKLWKLILPILFFCPFEKLWKLILWDYINESTNNTKIRVLWNIINFLTFFQKKSKSCFTVKLTKAWRVQISWRQNKIVYHVITIHKQKWCPGT